MTITTPYTIQGKGTRITFSGSDGTFAARITNLDWDGIERADIDTSHFGTTSGFMTFQGSTIANPGELTLELIFDPEAPIAVLNATETITVTFPVPAGGTAGATWASAGYVKSYKFGAPLDDKYTATAVLKFSGVPTITAAS